MAGAANVRSRRTHLRPKVERLSGEKAEREGFEPSTHLLGTHAISSRAPSANSDTSPRASRVPLDDAKEGVHGGNHGFPHQKREAPPTMSTGPPRQGSGESGTPPLRAGRRPAHGHGTAESTLDKRPLLSVAQWSHLTTLRMFENSSVQTGCPGRVSSRFQRGSSTSVPSAALFRATRIQIELAAPSLAAACVTA